MLVGPSYVAISTWQSNKLRWRQFASYLVKLEAGTGYMAKNRYANYFIVLAENVKKNDKKCLAEGKKTIMEMWGIDNDPELKEKNEKKNDAYNTWYSQVVTHPSTNHAQRSLTSVIGREPVYST